MIRLQRTVTSALLACLLLPSRLLAVMMPAAMLKLWGGLRGKEQREGGLWPAAPEELRPQSNSL